MATLEERAQRGAKGRIENLEELVSAARDFEQRSRADAFRLRRTVLSLLSEVDEEEGGPTRASGS